MFSALVAGLYIVLFPSLSLYLSLSLSLYIYIYIYICRISIHIKELRLFWYVLVDLQLRKTTLLGIKIVHKL